MEAMTKSWTDERLEERFDRIDQRFDAVDQRFDRMESRFDRMESRFDAMQRLILQVGGGMIATSLVGFLGLIAAQL